MTVGIGWGLVCSVVLHVLVALLVVFGLPRLLQAPSPVEEAVSVDLVEFDGVSTSPGQKAGRRQQEKPPDSSKPEPPKCVPLAEVEPQLQEKPPDSSKPEPPKRDPLAEVKPQPRKKQSFRDDIDTLLKLVEKSHGQAVTLPGRQPRKGPAASDLTASNDNAALGQQGARGVKDFIRAQTSVTGSSTCATWEPPIWWSRSTWS